MGLHFCHANGCEDSDAHPDLPFCEYHFKMLPVAHQNKLWRLRADGCHLCLPWEEDEQIELTEDEEEWFELANLGIALLCRIEYGRHGCPKHLLDDQGFCWGCGCHGAPKVYEVAEAVIRKYNLPVMETQV